MSILWGLLYVFYTHHWGLNLLFSRGAVLATFPIEIRIVMGMMLREAE
jgi:hypothetical protein